MDNPPAANRSEQQCLDTSHQSDTRGEHRYDDVHQTGPQRDARQDRENLKQRLAPVRSTLKLASNWRTFGAADALGTAGLPAARKAVTAFVHPFQYTRFACFKSV